MLKLFKVWTILKNHSDSNDIIPLYNYCHSCGVDLTILIELEQGLENKNVFFLFFFLLCTGTVFATLIQNLQRDKCSPIPKQMILTNRFFLYNQNHI